MIVTNVRRGWSPFHGTVAKHRRKDSTLHPVSGTLSALESPGPTLLAMRIKRPLLLIVLLSIFAAVASAQQSPLRIFLRGGPKTHGPGQHDHPRFVSEWRPLLESRGATVRGGLRFPTAAELAETDVLVMYAAEAGTIEPADRAALDTFLKRGGGIAAIHDAVCGTDPQWYKTIIGGAWEHGKSKWMEGSVDIYPIDTTHPVTQDVKGFRFNDEIYYDLHLMPEARVLMAGFHTPFDTTPQMWVYEKDAHRAFVSIQGHEHDSFSHDAWRVLLLRGIAWAGRRNVDLLLKPGEAGCLTYPTGGPIRPDSAAGKIQIHPEFDLSLVAAEPQVVNPISIDWDHRGRMWAVLTRSYPEKQQFSKRAPADEIVILEDDNRDGRADRVKSFYKGIDLATSLVLHENGIIVAAAPEIFILRDMDGDDVADRKEVLFKGFGFGDTHATISNFRHGLDGWVYGTQGYSGGDSNHIINNRGRDFGRIGNGIFRFRPDGSEIEMVSAYGSNTWGLDFSFDGELFFTMANGAHLRHVVVPERVLQAGRTDNTESWADIVDHDRVNPIITHTEPAYAQIDFVGGFTAAAGSTMYTGGAWPEPWSQAHFVTEPTVHIVHHDSISPAGATYKAVKTREAEFVAGSDLWFRPIHTRVGPDGALYILDFYNQAAIHNDTRGPKHGPTNAAVRPDRDQAHGRIWRMQHKAAKELPAIALNDGATAARINALSHPNMWVRMTAQRLICEQPAAETARILHEQLGQNPGLEFKIHSLWILAKLAANPRMRLEPEIHKKLVLDAMRHESAAVRKNAIQSAAACGLELLAGLDERLTDTDERTRLAAWITAGNHASPSSIQKLPEAWKSAGNPWMRAVLVRFGARNITNILNGPGFGAGLEPGYVSLAVRRGMRNASVEQVGGVLEWVAANRTAQPALGASILAAIRNETRLSGDVSPLAKPLALLLNVPSQISDAAEADVVRESLGLAMHWSLAETLGDAPQRAGNMLLQKMNDASAPVATRVSIAATLARWSAYREHVFAFTAQMLQTAKDDSIARLLLDVYARSGDDGAGASLVDVFGSLSGAARDRAFDLIVERKEWTEKLLTQVENELIAPIALGPQKLHRLRSHPDAETGARATKIIDGILGRENARVEEIAQRLLPEVDRPGDVDKGRFVFIQNCAVCHKVNGVGGKVGPDITGMGTHGARALLPVILDPSREVEPGYAEWVAWLKDGRTVSGILARDGEQSILLRSSSGEIEVQRSDITELKNTGKSPMPGGFESLGSEKLRDLIAYLSGGYAGYRVLDLRNSVTSSAITGLYDVKRDAKPMKFKKYGVVDLDGVPFEILDPKRTDSGNNAIVLKGGIAGDWDSKLKKPQHVSVKAGFPIGSVQVIGGIGAYAHPFIKEIKPILKWTWHYADGSAEEVILKNGVEFADWIGHHDVPGSRHISTMLTEDSWGQVRLFEVKPGKSTPVDRIDLDSFDNEFAPTLFAMTAALPGAVPKAAGAKPAADVVIFGGGSSHDFDADYKTRDMATLAGANVKSVQYTDSAATVFGQFARLKTLVLCTNQPVEEAMWRGAFFQYLARGGGLVVLHPANWYNWPDWPEYNKTATGGGARSHEAFQEFEVTVRQPGHALMRGVPEKFRIVDELYEFKREADGAAIEVLAVGKSLKTGAEYPVVWTVAREAGRTVCITLGHDAKAHDHEAFKVIYLNAVNWTAQKQQQK